MLPLPPLSTKDSSTGMDIRILGSEDISCIHTTQYGCATDLRCSSEYRGEWMGHVGLMREERGGRERGWWGGAWRVERLRYCSAVDSSTLLICSCLAVTICCAALLLLTRCSCCSSSASLQLQNTGGNRLKQLSR